MGRTVVHRDKNDAKEKGAPVVDIWGGKTFGFYQLLHYICSCIGMVYYFISFMTGRPLEERVFNYGCFEALLLVTRWGNEIYFEKWGVGDVFHHVTGFLSFYLVFNVDSCREFGWALCQMQVLHVPMFLWYLGCRRGCYATSPSITNPCMALFPFAWIVSTAYRSSIMLSIARSSFAASNYVPLTFIVAFACVLAYLDINWTAYFLKEIGWFTPSPGASDTQRAVGVYLGGAAASVVTILLSAK